MQRKTEAKLNMYHAVANHCNNNTSITSTIPAFHNAVTLFNTKINSLLNAVRSHAQVLSGIASDKLQAKTTLARQAADIAAAVFAYAASINNYTLKEQVNFSVRKIIRTKDELVASLCFNIHSAASTHVAALASYGITPAKLAGFSNTISNYTSMVSLPRNAVSLRVAYKKEIDTLIRQTDQLLKNQLDKLSLQFKTSHPGFYYAYKSNRIIIDPAGSGAQTKNKTIDELNQEEINRR